MLVGERVERFAGRGPSAGEEHDDEPHAPQSGWGHDARPPAGKRFLLFGVNTWCPCLLPPLPLCKAPPCALPLSPCATGSRVSLLLLSLVSERDMLGRGRSLSRGVLNEL